MSKHSGKRKQKNLLCQGRELEDVERLIEGGGILVDVHHHGDPARTTEEELQEVSQFGLSEWNVVLDSAQKHVFVPYSAA